jgi:hypothetical protein
MIRNLPPQRKDIEIIDAEPEIYDKADAIEKNF